MVGAHNPIRWKKGKAGISLTLAHIPLLLHHPEEIHLLQQFNNDGSNVLSGPGSSRDRIPIAPNVPSQAVLLKQHRFQILRPRYLWWQASFDYSLSSRIEWIL
jgi:hypothetical protein